MASGISVMIPMGCGFIYFFSKYSVLKFTRFPLQISAIGQIFFNGSSEMIGQLSIGFTTWVFNRVILFRMGVDGLAAYTILGYITFVQTMVITGFAIGLGPIAGYSFGAGKKDDIRKVMNVAMGACFLTGFFCWIIVFFSSNIIAGWFFLKNDTVTSIAESGFYLFAAAFLFNGFNMMITAFFTAIGEAFFSLIIAFLRGVLLINLFVVILPQFFSNAGVWLSFPLSEVITFGVSLVLLKKSSFYVK